MVCRWSRCFAKPATARAARTCAVCVSRKRRRRAWDVSRAARPVSNALPVYRSEDTEPARIDACDTCHAYMKTIDLTRHGAACPIADDLASVSLDFWAREHGYHRVRPNLLRL